MKENDESFGTKSLSEFEMNRSGDNSCIDKSLRAPPLTGHVQNRRTSDGMGVVTNVKNDGATIACPSFACVRSLAWGLKCLAPSSIHCSLNFLWLKVDFRLTVSA